MKIAVLGYYGFGNTGDEAILEAIRENLKEIKVVKRFDIFGLLTCDVLLVGGGGLFQDSTSTRSFLYYVAMTRLAKLFRKKVFIFAQGIGPIKKESNKRILKSTLEIADIITVRDIHSFNFVKSLKLKNPKVVETADPAILLEPDYQIIRISDYQNCIGVCLRESDKAAVIAQALDNLTKLTKKRIIFIPFQRDRDVKASEEVAALMKEKSVVLRNEMSVRQTLGVISSLELIIGMRLHSLIFAASALVPAVGLSYDPKVAAFMEEVGLPVFEMTDLNTEELVAYATDLLDNKEGVKRSLAQARDKLVAKARLNFGMIGMIGGK